MTKDEYGSSLNALIEGMVCDSALEIGDVLDVLTELRDDVDVRIWTLKGAE